MKSLIIFAGAGASRGVSGDKYPMALDFRKRLPDAIKNSHLYSQLLAHLSKSGHGDNIDIEHILWELGRLNSTLDEWTDSAHFASQLLTTNQINVAVKSNHSGQNIYVQFDALKRIVHTLQDQINERVYEYYSQPPDTQELERSWIPLLDRLLNAGFERIDIVTTNYDLVIESALRSLPKIKISMGLGQSIYPGIDLEAWRKTEPSGGMLTKLHGSVDWKLGNGSTATDPVIRRGHPEFDGDHKKRLILYPGFKGVPAREPFITFHDYFRRILKDASHLLFVGFAFRDDFINEVVTSSLPPKSSVAVINPASLPTNLPFLHNAIHMQQGFGIEKNTNLLTGSGLTPLSFEDIDAWISRD